jgi:hypothetical protein
VRWLAIALAVSGAGWLLTLAAMALLDSTQTQARLELELEDVSFTIVADRVSRSGIMDPALRVEEYSWDGVANLAAAGEGVAPGSITLCAEDPVEFPKLALCRDTDVTVRPGDSHHVEIELRGSPIYEGRVEDCGANEIEPQPAWTGILKAGPGMVGRADPPLAVWSQSDVPGDCGRTAAQCEASLAGDPRSSLGPFCGVIDDLVIAPARSDVTLDLGLPAEKSLFRANIPIDGPKFYRSDLDNPEVYQSLVIGGRISFPDGEAQTIELDPGAFIQVENACELLERCDLLALHSVRPKGEGLAVVIYGRLEHLKVGGTPGFMSEQLPSRLAYFYTHQATRAVLSAIGAVLALLLGAPSVLDAWRTFRGRSRDAG